MAASGAALQFAELQFGGPVTETDETVSVGTSATKIVGNDPDRVMLMLINLGGNPVYVAPNNQVSDSAGISLSQNGGSMVTIVRDDGTLPTREWWGLASTSAANVYVLSIRRYGLTGG